jgi:pilus assembly protein CpaC
MFRCVQSMARKKYGCANFAAPLIAWAVIANFWILISTGANAQPPQLVQRVVVTLYRSVTLPVPRPFSSAVVGSPDIADAIPMTDQTLYIVAKKVGTTSVSIYDADMHLMKVVDVEVAFDAQNLQSKIWTSTHNSGIRVSNNNGQVVLSGTARDAVAADRAVNLAKAWMPNSAVVNAMSVASPQEVMLKVRFLEVSRDAGRELGINWAAINGSGTRGVTTGLGGLSTPSPQTCSGTACPPVGSGIFQTVGTLVGSNVGAPFGVILAEIVNKGIQIDGLITALETKGLLQRLAEPNLVALSGDTASFQAGGQFPVPIAVTSGIGIATPTIEFKDFGVLLKFRPTVLNNGIINLAIHPEVSELDFSNAVTISGTTIPSITRRAATTTVELRDGQSFAIAGLLQANNLRDISQLPWLGTVPILGALFRSSAYQKSETDLVIIVTPSLVQPAPPGAHLATPFDDHLPSNDIDFFLLGQMELRKNYTDYVASGGDIQGPYGDIMGVLQEPAVTDPHK